MTAPFNYFGFLCERQALATGWERGARTERRFVPGFGSFFAIIYACAQIYYACANNIARLMPRGIISVSSKIICVVEKKEELNMKRKKIRNIVKAFITFVVLFGTFHSGLNINADVQTYSEYSQSTEEQEGFNVVKLPNLSCETQNPNRVSATSFTNIYAYRDGTTVIERFAITVNFSYNIPAGGGDIAQITLCTVTSLYKNPAANYYLDWSNVSKTIVNGSLATANVVINGYNKTTGAFHGSCNITEYCYANGAHS